VIDSTSAGLRRELGAVAWSALEVLALAAELTGDGQLVATLNAREVASALGVGREAAGRALALLRRRELVVLVQSRRARRNIFVGATTSGCTRQS
jgi:DNA-binding MarR family transcriptional regulator